MASVNKVILIGNLGNAPEIRYMPNGEAVASLSIATTETWTKDGEKHEKTEWHRLVAYRKLAEIVSEYLVKGSSIYIEGKLQTRKYDKDGVTHYTTEVIMDKLQMLGSKKGGDNEPSGDRESSSKAPHKDSKPKSDFDDFDDDIPF